MTKESLTAGYDNRNRLTGFARAGEAASVTYLHNELGQRVFKSEVTTDQTLPNATTLGTGFVSWLRANFQWMFAQAQASASIPMAQSGGSPLIQFEAGCTSRVCRMTPNPSVNRSANGRPPGLGWWYAVYFHQSGPGGLPLAPGYLERSASRKIGACWTS